MSQVSWTTFFHSAYWASLLQKHFGYRWRPWAALIGGQEVRAGLFECGGILKCGPIGYGGFITLNPQTRDPDWWYEVLSAIQNSLEMPLIGTIFPPHVAELHALSEEREALKTSVVSLGISYEFVWRSVLSGNARTMIRRARLADIVVKEVRDRSVVAAVYPLYLETMKHVGALYLTPLALLQEMIENDDVWFALATQGLTPVAFGVFLRCRLQVFHWISASDRSHREMNANAAILDWALKRAIEAGVNEVNLGASHSLSQVEYKTRFGGKQVPYYRYSFR